MCIRSWRLPFSQQGGPLCQPCKPPNSRFRGFYGPERLEIVCIPLVSGSFWTNPELRFECQKVWDSSHQAVELESLTLLEITVTAGVSYFPVMGIKQSFPLPPSPPPPLEICLYVSFVLVRMVLILNTILRIGRRPIATFIQIILHRANILAWKFLSSYDCWFSILISIFWYLNIPFNWFFIY